MTTADWCLSIVLFSAPLLEMTFERAYDAVTSRSRRLWWETHYRSVVKSYLDRLTSEREYDKERTEFESFWRECKAQVASWQCREYRMAA